MKNKKSSYGLFLKHVAHLQIKHPIRVLIVILLLTALLAIPAKDVRTVASLEQMMPQDTPEIAAFNQLRDQGLGRDAIAIVLRTNKQSLVERTTILTPDTYTYLQTVHELLAQESSINSIQSIHNSPVSQFVNADETETLLIAFSDAAGDDARMKRLAQRVQEIAHEGVPAGTNVYLTGTPIIQQRLGEYIQSDQKTTRLASTVFVLIITAVLFGLTSSIIPILSVTISVSWLYGTMGLVDLPISTLAGGVAAMVIGIGIDFALHLMNKFKFERKQGYSIPDAIQEAVMHTGSALSVTALTTGAAFLSFLIGVMPEMGRFGVLMALGIFYSLLLTLFALPALLVLEEKIIAYISKQGHFGIEGEYRLTREDES